MHPLPKTLTFPLLIWKHDFDVTPETSSCHDSSNNKQFNLGKIPKPAPSSSGQNMTQYLNDQS